MYPQVVVEASAASARE